MTIQQLDTLMKDNKVKQYFITFNDEKFTAEHHFIYENGTVKTVSEHRWEYEQRRARVSLQPRVVGYPEQYSH